MKTSRRSRRMQRHHKRHKVASLNLVSLMDIFTILVFFLLVHSGTPQTINPPKTLRLPESVADKNPEASPTLLVDEQGIYLENNLIVRIQDIVNSDQAFIPLLQDALIKHLASTVGTTTQNQQHRITIVGDKKIPYRLLEKIIASCNLANYSQISLAVQHISEQGS